MALHPPPNPSGATESVLTPIFRPQKSHSAKGLPRARTPKAEPGNNGSPRKLPFSAHDDDLSALDEDMHLSFSQFTKSSSLIASPFVDRDKQCRAGRGAMDSGANSGFSERSPFFDSDRGLGTADDLLQGKHSRREGSRGRTYDQSPSLSPLRERHTPLRDCVTPLRDRLGPSVRDRVTPRGERSAYAPLLTPRLAPRLSHLALTLTATPHRERLAVTPNLTPIAPSLVRRLRLALALTLMPPRERLKLVLVLVPRLHRRSSASSPPKEHPGSTPRLGPLITRLRPSSISAALSATPQRERLALTPNLALALELFEWPKLPKLPKLPTLSTLPLWLPSQLLVLSSPQESLLVSMTPSQHIQTSSSRFFSQNYTLLSLIGRGASARVYRAVNVHTSQVVAIKQLVLPSNPDGSAALMSEIELLKTLRHHHIVKYHGFVKTRLTLNIVLEHCAGGSLRQLYRSAGHGLSEDQVAPYVRQILLGLEYLHGQEVVHRDVKAANVLLADGVVKLADFGVAARVSARDCEVVGTPNWMAPETVLGDGDGCCTALDIWSLGSTIIELLTTHPPYYQLNPMAALHAIGTDVHPPLPPSSPLATEFLLQCFVKDPAARPSAEVLLAHPWVVSQEDGVLEGEGLLGAKGVAVSPLAPTTAPLLSALAAFHRTKIAEPLTIALHEATQDAVFVNPSPLLLLPMLRLLELAPRYPELSLWESVAVLLNSLLGSTPGILRRFCCLGGIPAFTHLANATFTLAARLQIVRFVRMLAEETEPLTMFVACGGLRLLLQFLKEDLASGEFALAAIEVVHAVVLEGSDQAWVVSRSGAVEWLGILLHQCVKLGLRKYTKMLLECFDRLTSVVVMTLVLCKGLLRVYRLLDANGRLVVLRVLSTAEDTQTVMRECNGVEGLETVAIIGEERAMLQALGDQMRACEISHDANGSRGP